jgi:hypothetical protein
LQKTQRRVRNIPRLSHFFSALFLSPSMHLQRRLNDNPGLFLPCVGMTKQSRHRESMRKLDEFYRGWPQLIACTAGLEALSGKNQSPRWGLRGAEDLGGGNSAVERLSI